MGNTKNTAGKRVYDDIYSFPQDMQELADDVHASWNVRVGTALERQNFPAAQLRDGLTWVETDTRLVRQWFTGPGWTGEALGTVFRRISGYNFGTSASVVAWNAADFSGSDFTHSGGTMTFTRPGTYMVAFAVTCGTAANAGSVIATLRKNGAGVSQVLGVRSTSAPVTLSASISIQVAVGDTLALEVISLGTAVAADVSSGRNYISITPIR